jgi:hypothetical protein
MAKHIMDVSRWQGRIDWGKVKASGLVSGVMQKTRRTLRKLHCKEDIMASTTYDHFANPGKMYAAREQFRHVTKMVCGRFRDLTKTYHLGNVTVMVRNAGQLPEPFWLGAARGGGSCSASRCAARA